MLKLLAQRAEADVHHPVAANLGDDGQLSDLITATTRFEIERRSPGDRKQPLMYAGEKRRARARRPAKSATDTASSTELPP